MLSHRGLKSDGTVVAVGDNGYGQLNVGSWSNIVQVAAGDYHTVGLKSDGTVVAVGSMITVSWTWAPGATSCRWPQVVTHRGIEVRRHGGGRGME